MLWFLPTSAMLIYGRAKWETPSRTIPKHDHSPRLRDPTLRRSPWERKCPISMIIETHFPSLQTSGARCLELQDQKTKTRTLPSYSHRWPILTTSLERPWAERNGVTWFHQSSHRVSAFAVFRVTAPWTNHTDLPPCFCRALKVVGCWLLVVGCLEPDNQQLTINNNRSFSSLLLKEVN